MTEAERAYYLTATATDAAVVGEDDLRDVLAFWADARGRGWTVDVPVERAGWRATGPARVAGVGYRPADDLCNGEVSAHDGQRTVTRTGVATAAAAVAVMREFLDWPA